MKAIICGAGIAGLSAAWYLERLGWDVVLVEKAAGLRDEGYMIDFFGSGYDVAQHMAILPDLAKAAYYPASAVWVNRNGKKRSSLSYKSFRNLEKGRLLSLMRGDLERVLFEHLPGRVEVRFGQTIEQVHSVDQKANVTLSNGERMTSDLLIGAGGIHSPVRNLVFGPERQFCRYLGYHTAAFLFRSHAICGALAGRVMLYSEPNRQVGLYAIRGGRIASFFVHASPERALPNSPLEALQQAYGDMGWLVPETLQAAKSAHSIYYDQVAQVEMPTWRKGRAVLIGDAAYAVSLLAGQGASLAMGGAYVLAEELRRPGSIDDALARYEQRLMPRMRENQAAGRKAAAWIVPGDWLHLRLRDWMLKFANVPGLQKLLAPSLVAGSQSIIGD